MTRVMTAAVLFLIAAVLPAQNSGQDEAALQKLWSQFEEAYNRSDATKVASRTEIAAQYEKEFATRRSDPSTVPFHARLAIRLLDASVAILDGDWEGFREGKRVRGQFTVIARKGASGWQIAAGRVRGLKEL